MSKKKINILHYTPSILWLFAGSLLIKKGIIQLIQKISFFQLFFIIIASILLGLIKYHFIFKKIIISQIKKTFSKSFFKEFIKTFFHIKRLCLVSSMILLSKLVVYLTKNSFFLSPIKIGIGFALILSSIIYTYFLNKCNSKNKIS